MVLSDDQIKQYILQPQNAELIAHAVDNQRKARLFIQGIGLDKFLEKVDKVENDDYIKLKKKLTNAKTVAVYEQALRPVDKIFTAKGGSITYKVKNESGIETIRTFINSNIYDGYDLDEYLEKIWANYSIWVDPIGLVLIEWNKQLLLPELRYIQLSEGDFINIHDISYESFDYINYIILNEGEQTIRNVRYRLFSIYDDEKFIQVRQRIDKKEDIVILKDTYQRNEIGVVPACLNSNRIAKKDVKLYDSYASESFYIADNYLNDFADYRIYKKKLGIPRFWEYKQACVSCGGTGEKLIKSENLPNGNELVVCNRCQGSGIENERNLTDIQKIEPSEGENYIPPAGVVTLPTDIQVQMLSELNEMEIAIYDTIWGQGSYVEKDRKNTTAFEISTRNELQQAKLKAIERNRVTLKEKLITLIGKYLLRENFVDVIVRPNTKFALNTSSENLQLYFEAKNKKASSGLLNKLYFDYLESEFSNDFVQYERQKKLLLINPAPHNEVNEVANLLSSNDLELKTNFERYIEIFESNVGQIENPDYSVQYIYDTIINQYITTNDLRQTQNNRDDSNI